MNTKFFSGILLSSVVSISACQAEKDNFSQIESEVEKPEKALVIQAETQKSVIEKLEKASEEASQKLEEFNAKLVETQKEYEEKKKIEAEENMQNNFAENIENVADEFSRAIGDLDAQWDDDSDGDNTIKYNP